ncbi:Alpha/Beta hydrolase protein [Xylariaceae sp. FL1272]|nr:Alpha/Beta hydrolase protein [Xylariaceae sp. FL1272]
MRLFHHILLRISLLGTVVAIASSSRDDTTFEQHKDVGSPASISNALFASFERLSRLVDITYCVGTTGIHQPFSCLSRCKDFPSLELVTTWNTGALMSDSCGYIAVDHGIKSEHRAIIMAFRGTYSITNTVIDLSTIPQEYVPYPAPDGDDGQGPDKPEHMCLNCTVHLGFSTSWQITRRTVLPELKRLHTRYPDYPIHIIGHSLGGAVSALAALELKVILGWDDMVVTTFGEPRVGNVGFTEYLDTVFALDVPGMDQEQRVYRRITHIDDPVPLLPLSEWGYRSHAGEFFISKYDLSPQPSDIRPCIGDCDPQCVSGSEEELVAGSKGLALPELELQDTDTTAGGVRHLPARIKPWELFFAHRDYFWRLGLCIPGGDPVDWGRSPYPEQTENDEL